MLILIFKNVYQPFFVSYQSFPTALIRDSVTVKNISRTRGTVYLFPVDAITGQSSGTAFTDPHHPQHDVGAWIKLSIQQVTLNPGQSLDIPFSLKISHYVRPGQHGGGILAEMLVQAGVQTSTSTSRQATFQFQSENILGVLVNLPGAIMEKLNITGITYAILLAVLWSLFSLSQKLYRSLAHWKQKSRGTDVGRHKKR